MKVNFVTGNDRKFTVAESICKSAGIEIERFVFDIDEIQGEDPESIITDKVKKAYELIGEPVVVGDDSWSISALNGFPGAYMKSINHWFETEDFLNLLKDKKDRSVLLIRYLAYYDGLEVVLFRQDSPGQIAKEIKGNSSIPWRNICQLDADDGLTLAEIDEAGLLGSADRNKKHIDPWHDLVKWLKEKSS